MRGVFRCVCFASMLVGLIGPAQGRQPLDPGLDDGHAPADVDAWLDTLAPPSTETLLSSLAACDIDRLLDDVSRLQDGVALPEAEIDPDWRDLSSRVRELREAGLAGDDDASQEGIPHYWAAFVLHGNPD